MPSSYNNALRLEMIGTGEQAGIWGETTNNNLGTLLVDAVAGYTSVSITSSSQALTAIDGLEDQSRNAMIALTTTTTANFSVFIPASSKTYIFYNASSYVATIYNSTVTGNTTAAGTGVAIPAGKVMTVWSEGTNVAQQNTHLISPTLASPTMTTPALGTPSSGTLTNATGLPLTTGVTGTLPIANGGTGATTAATARSSLGLVIGTDVPSPTGTGASGNWNINVTGNAATVTNGLTTSNYNSYAPTLTGGNASGTWNINVTGNAATATNGLTTSNYNSYAPTLTGGNASGTWNINVTGNAATVTNGLTTSNYNSYAPTLTGGNASGTWNINVTGNAATASNGGVTSVNSATGAVDLASLAAFAKSLGTNGYQKLPGGLIIQWGTGTIPNGSTGLVSVTFPIPFPTACYTAIGTPNISYSVSYAVLIDDVTTSGMRLNLYYTSGIAVPIFWIALGS